jgi:hypothetical protein
VVACSSGYGAVYPITTVTSFDTDTDETRGYIVSDLGAFDQFALLGLPSQVEDQRHPLLVQVLAVERSLEVLMSDLEFDNKHTVVDNVELDREYANKVVEYRVWWAGWQNRLSMNQQCAEFLLSQLDELNQWLPPSRIEQYLVATKQMELRLKRVIACCKSATVFGQTISNRLAAWQDDVSVPIQLSPLL